MNCLVTLPLACFNEALMFFFHNNPSHTIKIIKPTYPPPKSLNLSKLIIPKISFRSSCSALAIPFHQKYKIDMYAFSMIFLALYLLVMGLIFFYVTQYNSVSFFSWKRQTKIIFQYNQFLTDLKNLVPLTKNKAYKHLKTLAEE